MRALPVRKPFRIPSCLRCAGLLAVLLLSGCGSPGLIKHDSRLTELRNEEPKEAWLDDGLLIVRYQADKDDSYAGARWLAGELPRLTYTHTYSRLEFLGEELPQELADTAGLSRVSVQTSNTWLALLRRLVDDLVPAEPGLGVALHIRNDEQVIYRDASGNLARSRFGEQPDSVKISNSFDLDSFLKYIATSMEVHVAEMGIEGRQLLFQTNSLNRATADLILLDRDRLDVVAITIPIGDENTASRSIIGLSVDSFNTLVIRGHVFAFIKNPVTSVTRLVNFALTTTYNLVNLRAGGYSRDLPEAGTQPPMNMRIWEETLDELVSEKPIPARLTFLIGGQAYFSDLINSFNLARNRIDIRVYIFDTDDYAVTIANQLKALSKKLKIKILVDDLGTLTAGLLPPATPMPSDFLPPASIVSYLKKDSKLKVRRAANTWLTSDHTKTLVVDNEIAYIGGMNIGREYRYEWHDMMVKLEGPIVDQIRGDFSRAWGHAGIGGDLDYLWRTIRYSRDIKAEPEPGQIMVRPLYTRTGTLEIFNAQRAAIKRARNHIYIQNAYLSDNTILRGLIAARKRGVDVRVIIPGDNDSGIMAASNAVTANVLIAHGVRVYRYPKMTHIKAAIYDGWACVGSANFDKLSFFVNQEMNIGISDPDTVDYLRRELFEKDFALSSELLEPITAEWTDYLSEIFADQL